jgi:outer membrane protein
MKKNMKNTLILLLTVFALNAFAYSQAKIGVFDAQEILQKSKKGLQIQKELENLQQSKQGQLQRLQDKIKTLEKELLSPALNGQTREKKSRDLLTERKNLKRSYEDAQREFQRKSQIALLELEKELIPLITNYGKSRGFTVIYDRKRSGIVYFDKGVNITAEIIKEIDARTP